MKNPPARKLCSQLMDVADDLGMVQCHLDALHRLVDELIIEEKGDTHFLLAINCIREHIATRIKGDIRVIDTVRKHPLLDGAAIESSTKLTAQALIDKLNAQM